MNRRFKVLNICSWYPNDFNPTLGNFVQKHAESISIQNDVITLAIFPDSSTQKQRFVQNIGNNLEEIIIYYPKRIKGFYIFNLIRNFIAHVKAFNAGYALVKSKMGKPDIVHLNIVYPLGIWAVWLKWIYKIPYVVTENSTGLHVGGDNVYPKHILKLCRFILRNADFLLPVSENLKSNMKLLSPKSRFSIISNVADSKLFAPNKNKVQTDKKQFIHISTANDRHKNISGMLRVLAELSKQKTNFHFNFVSDGDYQYAIDLAKKLVLDEFITFHSTKTTEEISQMIQDSDAHVLFSNYENFPCVIAESFMCGIPVISTNVNGIPEHVHSDNGILVNRGDEAALLTALLDFLNDKYDFRSEQIRTYALNHFSYEAVSTKFHEVYEKVINRQ